MYPGVLFLHMRQFAMIVLQLTPFCARVMTVVTLVPALNKKLKFGYFSIIREKKC